MTTKNVTLPPSVAGSKFHLIQGKPWFLFSWPLNLWSCLTNIDCLKPRSWHASLLKTEHQSKTVPFQNICNSKSFFLQNLFSSFLSPTSITLDFSSQWASLKCRTFLYFNQLFPCGFHPVIWKLSLVLVTLILIACNNSYTCNTSYSYFSWLQMSWNILLPAK